MQVSWSQGIDTVVRQRTNNVANVRHLSWQPTTNAGQSLQAHIFPSYTNPLIVRHAAMGDELLPWAIALFESRRTAS